MCHIYWPTRSQNEFALANERSCGQFITGVWISSDGGLKLGEGISEMKDKARQKNPNVPLLLLFPEFAASTPGYLMLYGQWSRLTTVYPSLLSKLSNYSQVCQHSQIKSAIH